MLLMSPQTTVIDPADMNTLKAALEANEVCANALRNASARVYLTALHTVTDFVPFLLGRCLSFSLNLPQIHTCGALMSPLSPSYATARGPWFALMARLRHL